MYDTAYVCIYTYTYTYTIYEVDPNCISTDRLQIYPGCFIPPDESILLARSFVPNTNRVQR